MAKFVILLGTNGIVAKQGAPSEILEGDVSLSEEVHHEAAALELDEHEGEVPKIAEDVKEGRLVVAEEIAVGRVSWQAGKCSVSIKYAYTQ